MHVNNGELLQLNRKAKYVIVNNDSLSAWAFCLNIVSCNWENIRLAVEQETFDLIFEGASLFIKR